MPDLHDMVTFLSGSLCGCFAFIVLNGIIQYWGSKDYKEKYDSLSIKAQMLKDENTRLSRQNEKIIAFIRERM